MSAGRRNRGQSPISAGLLIKRCLRGNRALTPISPQKGFTYLALLIAVAIGGGVLAAVGELMSHAQQREKEAELLFAGHQYRQAIAAYYERSPGGAKRFPAKLEDMLEDKRYPMPQRYLRKLYPDPATGKSEWGLMEAPGGGIMGVYSLAELRPIKSGGFVREDQSFADAATYAEWKFFYAPPKPSGAGTADPAAAPAESSGTPPADAAAAPSANPAAAAVNPMATNPAAATPAKAPVQAPVRAK